MALTSMTGYGAQDILHQGQSWSWEIRSVNGRNLDLKLRLPEGLSTLEPLLRRRLGAQVKRGSLQISLRRGAPDGLAALPAPELLDRIFAQIATVEAAAERAGVSLAPVRATDLLDGRFLPKGGEAAAGQGASPALIEALEAGFDQALAGLVETRAQEGRALTRSLSAHIDRIDALTEAAATLEASRARARAAALKAALGRVLEQVESLESGRLEQELALLAVKGDITEELERLRAHVAAARGYLEEPGPVGRKLDFLTQEFNREANTLCSKAQFAELTRIGLDLKAVIDQVREQVQNVE